MLRDTDKSIVKWRHYHILKHTSHLKGWFSLSHKHNFERHIRKRNEVILSSAFCLEIVLTVGTFCPKMHLTACVGWLILIPAYDATGQFKGLQWVFGRVYYYKQSSLSFQLYQILDMTRLGSIETIFDVIKGWNWKMKLLKLNSSSLNSFATSMVLMNVCEKLY